MAKDNTTIELTINRFDGGIAGDTLQAQSNEFALAKNFDIFTKKNRLIPYRDMEAEAGTLGAYAIKSVAVLTDSAGTQKIFALGNVSGQTYPQLLEKTPTGDDTMITGTFAESTTGAGAVGAVVASSLIAYKTKLFGLNLDTTVKLFSYDPQSNTYTAAVGNTADTTTNGIYPRMFRHPQDDILYIGVGNKISILNNTSFSANVLTLPSDMVITSLTDYGAFLAIACAPIDQGKKSYLFLWSRDTSLSWQETIDFGEGALMVIENVGGSLVGVSSSAQVTASVFDIAPKIIFREYTGGLARTFKEIRWSSTGASTLLLSNLKSKNQDKVHFPLKIYTENQTVFQIFSVGKNELGRLVVTADRLVNNDTAITAIDGFNMIGDYAWVMFNGDGSISRTNDAATYTATCVYDSAILTGGDSAKKKTLKMVTVITEAQPSAGQIQCYYRKDEETSYTRLFIDGTDNSISHASTRINNATEGGDTVTMTVASPCVVTLTAHKLVAGQAFKFFTSGALPTGVTAGQTYYVISTGLAADTFRFSATSGGSAVNSSGSQSGTHKLDRDAQLPTFKEIQIRVESVGGTVISGVKVKYEVIGKELA